MQKIVPHLWFDTEAAEAAEFYMSLFENSRLLIKNILKDIDEIKEVRVNVIPFDT